MLKILQARLQQYVNSDVPDILAGFRKGRGTRDQIANIRWIMENSITKCIPTVSKEVKTQICWKGSGNDQFYLLYAADGAK